jgi:hypothetical protein
MACLLEYHGMAMPNFLPNKVILLSRSLDDLSAFKKECFCKDFYIDRDALTLVGTFIEAQLKIAIEKYHALIC